MLMTFLLFFFKDEINEGEERKSQGRQWRRKFKRDIEAAHSQYQSNRLND